MNALSRTAPAVARRDRWLLLAAVAGMTAIAAAYLLWDAARMAAMPSGMAPMPNSTSHFVMTFLMWTVMMAGMMIPSAAPMLTLYAAMVRRNGERGAALPSSWVLAAGYLTIWTLFSFLAAFIQVGLQIFAQLSPMLSLSSPGLAGLTLLAAGAYQLLPWKNACLRRCRSPLEYFLTAWRGGCSGAFRMGLEQGAYCVGCCWGLMLVLFVVGVMNLIWVVLLAALVTCEKTLSFGAGIGRLTGVALCGAGLWQLAAALV